MREIKEIGRDGAGQPAGLCRELKGLCRGRKGLWRRALKKSAAGIVGLCLLAAQPLTALADAWERVGSTYQMADGTPINGAIARGIDASHWQQEIDWAQVRQDDVDFVMLGTRYKGAVDPNFRVNAEQAHAAGIQLGAYIYSYATSVAMAEQEADFVLDLIKDYPISYPVAFDAEDSGTLGTLSPSQVSEIINAFCRKIQAAGYHPMVYANEYWLNNKIDLSKLDYDVWVARYNAMYTYHSPSMWQATSTGSVNGIKGNVDIDFLFTEHTRNLPGNLWRTIGGSTYYYQDHQMQKAAWIHDGSGWFYMDEAGSPKKGWMTMPEGSYYLEEDTGRMATGWKELDGSWYHLKESGRMTTGWRQVDGSWYYMADDGRMQTGWQEIGGKRYHLASSGAMVTGWQQVDGARYYFQPSGEMSTGWADVDGSWYYLAGNGQMQTGWQEIGGVLYYLDSSGAMAADTELERDGVRYHADSSGACTLVPVEDGTTAGAGMPADAGSAAGAGTPAGTGAATLAGPGGV